MEFLFCLGSLVTKSHRPSGLTCLSKTLLEPDFMFNHLFYQNNIISVFFFFPNQNHFSVFFSNQNDIKNIKTTLF
jgi:hypothetical protein